MHLLAYKLFCRLLVQELMALAPPAGAAALACTCRELRRLYTFHEREVLGETSGHSALAMLPPARLLPGMPASRLAAAMPPSRLIQAISAFMLAPSLVSLFARTTRGGFTLYAPSLLQSDLVTTRSSGRMFQEATSAFCSIRTPLWSCCSALLLPCQ